MRYGNPRTTARRIPWAASIVLALACRPVLAVDCGTQGSLYPIQEQSALAWLSERLHHLQRTGELTKLEHAFKARVLASLERPKAVFGLTPTLIPKQWTKALTVTVHSDIQDAHGGVIYPAGTTLNPLANTLAHSHKRLLFFDGDDQQQLSWALKRYHEHPTLTKLVLVNGPVLQLIRTHAIPFYFDQTGRLSAYFGFQHIPAMVYQKDQQLMIAEVRID